METENPETAQTSPAAAAESPPLSPPLPSSSTSPSHEFSFTISFHAPNSLSNSTSAAAAAAAAIRLSNSPSTPLDFDFAPADDIFFHGHLLPLHFVSHRPSSDVSLHNAGFLSLNHIETEELTDSVRPSITNIAGCLHLLQVWSWEHIYIGRPTMYVPGWSEVFGMPLGYRWNEGWMREHPMNTLVYYRNEFDTLQQGQVTWETYTDDIFNTLPAICRAGGEIWRARVPLICWVRVEWYLPDRVMRQFGFQQHIDLEFIPTSFKRVDARGIADTNWLHYHRKECNLWDRRRDFVIQPQLVGRNPRRALSIYMTWYKIRARLYLIRVPAEEPDTYYPRAAIEREYAYGRNTFTNQGRRTDR